MTGGNFFKSWAQNYMNLDAKGKKAALKDLPPDQVGGIMSTIKNLKKDRKNEKRKSADPLRV